jgi:urocanate hydratase
MMLNSLDPEVAESPADLLISGSAGKAAADWANVDAIANILRELKNDESLHVQSGTASGVSGGSARSPRVIAINPVEKDVSTEFGNWLYVGTQTALPLLYEIYADAARKHFGGSLAGKLIVGGGMGGAGGAQPLAAALHGAAFLGIDQDAERIKRRVKSGYCEAMVNHLDEALRILKNAVRQRKSVSVGLIGNCSELFLELARRGVAPDLLTDYTSEPRSADQVQGIRDLEKLGTHFIDSLQAFDCLRPLTNRGLQLTTWIALSGERSDITRVDRLALDLFPDEEHLQRWLAIAGKYVRYQGLPARVTWFQKNDLPKLGHAVNDLVERGELSAPILIGFHSATPKFSAPDVASIHDGSCWVWDGGKANRPFESDAFVARAIVADGTSEAGNRLTVWPGI